MRRRFEEVLLMLDIDIAQKQILVWEEYDELAVKLSKLIKAIIG